MRLEPSSTKKSTVSYTLITDPKARRAARRSSDEPQSNKTHDTLGVGVGVIQKKSKKMAV